MILIELTATMNKSQVRSGSIVLFNWDGKKRNNPDSLLRTAERMHGAPAIIMERPFWTNNRRVQIRSLIDPNLTLAVKWKHLELIESLKSPTLNDSDLCFGISDHCEKEPSAIPTQHIKYFNRTTVTIYELVDSQKELHGQLHEHLLSTKQSNLFISGILVPEDELPRGCVSKNYWTQHDASARSLTEMLRYAEMWINLTSVSYQIVHTLHFFATQDTKVVDKLVESIGKQYSNTSEDHYFLCQDVRYALLVFRRMYELESHNEKVPDKMLHRIHLRITTNTSDILMDWWGTALCMYCVLYTVLTRDLLMTTITFSLIYYYFSQIYLREQSALT